MAVKQKQDKQACKACKQGVAKTPTASKQAVAFACPL
jgi:predicted RNA-binding Zn-ribbon protein involved in translation (DUF1610 family)